MSGKWPILAISKPFSIHQVSQNVHNISGSPTKITPKVTPCFSGFFDARKRFFRYAESLIFLPGVGWSKKVVKPLDKVFGMSIIKQSYVLCFFGGVMYRRKEVEEITGIPARRIQFYSDNGLLNLAEASPGRGRERKYTKTNLLELLVVKELAKRKIELSEIKRIMITLLRETWPDFLDMERYEKYDREVPIGHYIEVADTGKVRIGSYSGALSLEQLGRLTTEIEDYSSVLIINVNKLAAMIVNL
jgi:DNA-binding transcriptional MerR regulator